ncbi:MAG: hypothetical protein HQL32_14295 [Planctomycetes bacterium]|nr:hypothetical protein [Planctomycetota bacterium]
MLTKKHFFVVGVRILALILLFHLLSIGLIAAPKGKLRISTSGDIVKSGNVLLSDGRSDLYYGGYTLSSDFMKFDRASGNLTLFGDVVISKPGHKMRTLYFDYNYKTKLGQTSSIQGEIIRTPPKQLRLLLNNPRHKASRNYFFSAQWAEFSENIHGEPRMILRKPTFSDCDHNPPHHDLYASSAEFSSDDNIQMWNMRPRLMRVPYFYFPYFFRDLHHDWPWTRWTFGSKGEWGKYATFQTLALPKTLDERLKVGLDFREARGFAYKLDWLDDHPSDSSTTKASVHMYDESWRSNAGSHVGIDQLRHRLDYYHRSDVATNMKLTAEAHYLTPREEYYWTGGGGVVSRNLYAAPDTGGIQDRDSFLKEYYEDEFRTGRRLENSLSLDYSEGNAFFSLSTLFPVDEELTRNTVKYGNFRGRYLPFPVFGTDILYSNSFGVAYQGARYGRALTREDEQAVYGHDSVNDFLTLRVDWEQKIEKSYDAGPYLNLTPYVGQRLLIYEQSLDAEYLGQGVTWHNANSHEEKLADWKNQHRSIGGLVLSNTVTGYFDVANRKLKHQLRPSISMDYEGPSSYDRSSQVLAPVDYLDYRADPRLQTVYRLDNDIYLKDKSGKVRPLYSSILRYTFYNRGEDRTRFFGETRRSSYDAAVYQSFYPLRTLRLSSDIRINTFHGQVPSVRNGLSYSLDRYIFSYEHAYSKSLANPNANILDRHDFRLSYYGINWDVMAYTSYDAEPGIEKEDRRGLYKHGFREMKVVYGQLFHCLRGEVELKYDIESSGSTLILRFGPQIFGENAPNYRMPFD